ncbi:NPCBM/NEW2 domain-containing protein [Streptomyces sp. NPDC007346]|uniref:NPCBM/NEW2 domain-containing protein n=1 Tax=Streptomyces sp. NPDC007346 TaxID=3154682 RepID=UPI0034542A56
MELGAQVAHGQGSDGGDGVVARQEERERKDRLKAEFGGRLRVLLDLTGLSSREFAQRYPAYKDSTVRKYTLGANLPPWDFLHDLLTEVTRRTDDPAGPHRRTELFTAYRQVLIDTGADVRGSDQNSLLLRLLDGEEALARLGAELAQVRARENQLRSDLEEQIRQAGAGAEDRKRQFEEEGRVLAGRRSALVQRRTTLISELDTCRTQLAALEETDTESGLVPVSSRSGAGQDRTTLPPVPPRLSPGADGQRGTKRSGRRRAAALIGGAVAVVLLAGGGAAVGIWATGPHDDTGKATTPTPAPTTPAPLPTTAEPATPTPSTAPPGTREPSATGTPAPPPAPPAAGARSLVTDLAAFEDDGYLSGPQTVNLREYPDALHVPDSLSCETVATWQLDRAYTTLVTHVGIADDSPTSSSADFTVTVDDEAGFQRTMRVGQSAEKATVDITDAFRITLTINNCGAGGHGAWLNPTITR